MSADLSIRVGFLKRLQAVSNKIHATGNLDELMLELSGDLCELFECDRLTLYAVSEDRQGIVSKVKTGLHSFKDIRLPIAEQSVAGYVAKMRQLLNLRDVYDEEELLRYSPRLRFLREVDASSVYVNASTRFTDGGEFGLGAEIGISTQKLHARGPFAAEALTTYKYEIRGCGQTRP